jgi:hypothetical protein
MLPLLTEAAIQLKGGYLYTDLSLKEEYTTNVKSSSDTQADLITDVTPRIAYKTEGAMFAWEASVAVHFIRYNELTENDSEDFGLQLEAFYPNGVDLPYSLRLSLSSTESTQSSPEFGEVTRDRTIRAAVNGSYSVSELYSFSTGVDYSQTTPLSGDRSATNSYGIPLTISYRYSEALKYGIGYRLRKQESSGDHSDSSNSTDHAVFGTINGRISPLVDGAIQLGAQVRQSVEADSDDDELAPYVSGGLTWEATSLTTCNLDLSADFETTTGNQSSRNYGVNAGISHNFATNLDGNLTLALNQTEYSGNDSDSTDRSDNEWSLGTGLNTKYGKNTDIGLKLQYRKNNSTEDTSTYDELSLALRVARRF